MLTCALHASARQSPLRYSGGRYGQLRWQKKLIVISSDAQGCGAIVGVVRSPRRAAIR